MAQSQFALSWESYKTNICSGFSSFQQNGELVDMTLAADGHLVKVHQVLIALASPYLKELITSVPTQHPVIFLNNVSHVTLSLVLEYIYTGEVRVPAENLSSFVEAAKALHIRGLETITDSGHTAKIDIISSENNLDNSRTNKKPDQIMLPSNAKKIYVNINPDSPAMLSVKKPLVTSHADSNMHDYSERMDDTELDFDYDDDDNDTQNKTQSPGRTDYSNQISSAKVSAEKNKSVVRIADADGQWHTARALLDSGSEVNLISNKLALKLKLNSNLQFTVSIRGALQVILNRYIYNLHSSQSTGVRRWRCIDYRNKKCSAFVVTKGNVVMNRANPHNHSFHDKKILDKIEKNAVYSALDDVQELAIVKDKNRDVSQDSEFVSL